MRREEASHYLCLRGSREGSRLGCSTLPAVEMEADLMCPLRGRFAATPSPAPIPLQQEHNSQSGAAAAARSPRRITAPTTAHTNTNTQGTDLVWAGFSMPFLRPLSKEATSRGAKAWHGLKRFPIPSYRLKVHVRILQRPKNISTQLRRLEFQLIEPLVGENLLNSHTAFAFQRRRNSPFFPN